VYFASGAICGFGLFYTFEVVFLHYEDFRREYLVGGLARDSLAACPIEQFNVWLKQAIEGDLRDPTAMVLGTIDNQGLPWQRMVLMKGVSLEGFVFYTNYDSAKAKAIAATPQVSLLFPWNELERQVIVGGTVEKVAVEESTRYFLSRPRESQLAAWASQQSRSIVNEEALLQQLQVIKDRFGEGEIPLPDFWGGFRVVPQRIEFWQGGAHRLHDRFLYTRGSSHEWNIEQLQP
jgi:pyridoxamine 5'-phosphate oxidase